MHNVPIDKTTDPENMDDTTVCINTYIVKGIFYVRFVSTQQEFCFVIFTKVKFGV